MDFDGKRKHAIFDDGNGGLHELDEQRRFLGDTDADAIDGGAVVGALVVDVNMLDAFAKNATEFGRCAIATRIEPDFVQSAGHRSIGSCF